MDKITEWLIVLIIIIFIICGFTLDSKSNVDITKCVHGYVFYKDTQVYERGYTDNHPPQPMRCK